MPSCWRRPWVPLWSNDRSPPRKRPNTCVWTKGMTILQAVGLPLYTAIGSTSDASVRRSWTPLATGGIQRAGGLWNGRWHGYPNAVRSWFATTRRRRTTSECYNSHARSYGSVDSGVWPFRDSFLGVEPVDEMEFTLADGRLVSLPVGDVYLTVENRTAPSRVVFGEDGQCLLGATTLQVLGLIPDTTNHQLIPAPMLRI